jgi:hypothetical protein
MGSGSARVSGSDHLSRFQRSKLVHGDCPAILGLPKALGKRLGSLPSRWAMPRGAHGHCCEGGGAKSCPLQLPLPAGCLCVCCIEQGELDP